MATTHAARSALIIAAEAYTDPGLRQLRAPATDAQALEEVLRDPAIGGFEVRTLLNAPVHEVTLAVDEFFAERHPDDRSWPCRVWRQVRVSSRRAPG